MIRTGIDNIQNYRKPKSRSKGTAGKASSTALGRPLQAPVAAPKPPPAPFKPALPWDSIAQSMVDQAGKDFTYNTGSVLNDENRAGLDFGVQFDRGEDGGLSNFRIAPDVDVTNPFSRAALLKRSYLQNRAGTTNSLAARGQLHSGAFTRQQDDNSFRYGAGQDALLKNFGDLAGEFFQRRYDAQRARDMAPVEAQQDAIFRHQDDPPPGVVTALGSGIDQQAAFQPGTGANILASYLARHPPGTVLVPTKNGLMARHPDGTLVPA